MAILTPEQLERLRQIIEDASTSVAITTVGHEVTPEELQRLVDEGWVDPDQIDDVVLTGYQFGNLVSKLPQAEQMTFPQFAGYLEKNPIKLSDAEKHAVKVAQDRAGQYCTGLGSRYNDKAGTFIVQADDELARQTRNAIREGVSTKIAERTTRRKLAQDLGKLTGDWARDWRRIANTETHMAQQEGYLEDVRERHGDEELLAKIPEPNACKHCQRLYLDGEGQPIVRPASWWADQGASNAGRKTADWKPVLGAIHPWCSCRLIRVPDGWELRGEFPSWDLVPEGMDKSQAPKEKLIGGRGDNLPDSAFDARDLADGVDHELEHVKDRAVAKEIAKDHLAEDPDYYRKLKTIEKAGPYIGPRGGKWADPKHTIPWDDQEHHVKMHRKIFGAERNLKYRVAKRHDDGTVTLSQHADSDHGPQMPAESVKHFVNDLAGRVELPKHSRDDINAVIQGKAKLLGKGDDGIAFKVGNDVVKVSTTVPFQPENPGHRTPDEAADMLKRQVETGNKLADLGVKGIQRSEYVRHGDKGFQIKPWVEIPEKLTREQLDKIQQIVLDVHAKGYAIKDDIQAGLDAQGEPVMFDVGKAGKQSDATGIYADTRVDLDNLKRLYRDHGQKFVQLGVSEGQEALDRVLDKYEGWLSQGKAGLAKRHLDLAVKKLEAEARAQHEGKALERRLAEIEEQTWIAREEIEIDLEAAEKSLEKAGPYIGPRGGKWADPQHTIPWDVQEQAHSAVRDQVVAAAQRAVAAGADAKKLRYVGAGAEGIVFRQGDKAFKVARTRGRKLEMEAAAIEALSGHPNAPKFHKYDAENDVLVREHVEGKPGGWSDADKLHKVHEELGKKLKGAELTAPEFKEDSFVITPDGTPKLVDAGFVNPTGSRAARVLADRIGQAKPSDDAFTLRFKLRSAFSHGDIDHATALKLAAKLRETFGEGLEQDQLEESIAFTASLGKAWRDFGQDSFEKARKLHGRLKFQGFDISIENRKGSVRHWYDKHTDTEGQTKMRWPYGYIRLTEGMDGDHVDVFVGPDESADAVYVVHQMKAPDFKRPDEDKVMLGFSTAGAAKAAYLAHFDSPKFFGSMTPMGIEEFRTKVYKMRRKMIKARQLPLPFEKASSDVAVKRTAPIATMGQHDRGAARTAGANVQDRRTDHMELWPPRQKKKRKVRELVPVAQASDPTLAGVSQDQLVRAAERFDVRGLRQGTGWANTPKLDQIPELNQKESRTEAIQQTRSALDSASERRRRSAAGARLTLNPKLIRREQKR